MNSYFNTSNPEDIKTIQRLIAEVITPMSVDFINKLGESSGFDNDVVKSIKETELSMTNDEGQVVIIVSVDFIDKDGNEEGNAFIYIGKEDKVYLDYPY
ncbi:MAG: hypothetical protein JXR12_06625 [Neptunomonas phycophila]|uniref:hypothetical protein n=1 Tax=Neptunomonas phycophila TaxID=1572645 RepID=UPI003B8D34DA